MLVVSNMCMAIVVYTVSAKSNINTCTCCWWPSTIIPANHKTVTDRNNGFLLWNSLVCVIASGINAVKWIETQMQTAMSVNVRTLRLKIHFTTAAFRGRHLCPCLLCWRYFSLLISDNIQISAQTHARDMQTLQDC